jgi:hypothetical protein
MENRQAGWPMIAFGHHRRASCSGVCPSLSPTLLDSVTTVAALVSAGYVVTVSDYQGLGRNDTYHPYLDSTTVGYNLIDSVRAARKFVPNTSDRWAALGASQGGQAAWAANELADNHGWGPAFERRVSHPLPTSRLADAAAAGALRGDRHG